VVNRVLEDVVERLLVLLFGLDRFRPEPAAEDMVLSGVPLVEGAGVLTVQVAHAVGQIRERRLDQQVVVIPEQAAGVQAPAVAPPDAAEDVRKGGAVDVVAEDRFVVVPLRDDVVVRAFFEVAARTSHAGDRTVVSSPRTARSVF
jgi:hypothetical protein